MSDIRGFLKFDRETPKRRPVEARLKDWREFYSPLPEDRLRAQGARCMDCGVPFCQSPHGCPVENLIPDWNDLVHRGKWKEALKALHATNNFPEFTGKLCPAPCESACVLSNPAIGTESVAIRTLESAIIDRGFEEGWVEPVLPLTRSGKRVAIVGSGPAGLAAAQQLARAGHTAIVYEKASRPGGLLRYGIPEFKMEKRVLDRRLAQLMAEGVEFRTGVEVGVQISCEELLKSHDAVCLAIGAEQPRELPVEGRELEGVIQAMDYLTLQNRALESAGAAGDLGGGLIVGTDGNPRLMGLKPGTSHGNIPNGAPFARAGAESAPAWAHARGKQVIILGGGDTGSDCLGTARRQGCADATQFELLPEPPRARSERTPWPFWPLMLRTSHAHEEGCERVFSISTTGFIGEGGRVRALRAQRVSFEGGRPVPVPGTETEIPADLVILAMGFTGPKRNGLIEGLGLETDSRGNVATATDYSTSRGGVYAAGDARRGASLIVWAIAEGRKMAASVDRYLRVPPAAV